MKTFGIIVGTNDQPISKKYYLKNKTKFECLKDLLDDLTKYYNVRKYFTDINGLNDFYANSKVDKAINWMKLLFKNEFDKYETINFVQIIDKKKFIVFLNSSIIPFLIPIIIIIESNSAIEISIGFIYIIINNINVIIVNYII